MQQSHNAKNIVIKIGSALLIDINNHLREQWLQSIVDDIAALKMGDKNIIIVSSGAVAIGRKYINQDNTKSLTIEQKQAAAACGQVQLIKSYQKSLLKHNINSAQILLSLDDSDNRRRYLNAQNTITTLLNNQIIPIINENDTIATNELRFGDNDRLAARVAQMVSADLLILLSDVDGLYDANPHSNPHAKHIPIINEIDNYIENMADGVSSAVSSGGMKSKIEAAKIGISHGCSTIIASGLKENAISRLFNGAKHSLFQATTTPQNSRITWIANILQPTGTINIDDGAIKAIKSGKSLLAVGIINISGEFNRGDVVQICDKQNKNIAKGLVAYSIDDVKKIMGKQSDEITAIIGYIGRNEIVHRNDMALF